MIWCLSVKRLVVLPGYDPRSIAYQAIALPLSYRTMVGDGLNRTPCPKGPRLQRGGTTRSPLLSSLRIWNGLWRPPYSGIIVLVCIPVQCRSSITYISLSHYSVTLLTSSQGKLQLWICEGSLARFRFTYNTSTWWRWRESNPQFMLAKHMCYH